MDFLVFLSNLCKVGLIWFIFKHLLLGLYNGSCDKKYDKAIYHLLVTIIFMMIYFS